MAKKVKAKVKSKSNKLQKKDWSLIKRNTRLGIGFFLFFVGCFLVFSIVSYVFSWQVDQDSLFTGQSYKEFLLNKEPVVNNIGGRLGAFLSHFMVFQGAGIMSLMFALWIVGIGINLINGKKVFPIWGWSRWMIFGFLFFSPLFSLLLPDNSFPLGGALGNSLIDWTRGFAGAAGNYLMLGAVFCFFIFIIFQWDIKPWLIKASSIIPARGKDISAEPETEESDEFKGFRHFTAEEEKKMTENKSPQDKTIKEKEENIPEKEEFELKITNKILPPKTEVPSSTEGNRLVVAETEIEIIDSTSDDNLELKVISKKDTPGIAKGSDHISIESKEPYDPKLDLSRYKYPTLDLLNDYSDNAPVIDTEELKQNQQQIRDTLGYFGIGIKDMSATVGPTVTLYEIIPQDGVRISKIRNLEDDIALSLAALGIRIIAPIPGKGTVGIEVPNKKPQIVSMKTILSSEEFINNKMSLPIALGKKIDNDNYIVDLAKMPHLLMAGATGQGKSVGINAILVSLLYKKHPSQLKFVMVDPKKVELSIYRVIEKHYLAMLPNEEEPIITDTKKVVNTLNALTIEMDNRYDLLKEAGARNIKEYNTKFIKRKLNPNDGHKYLPFIVLVIDEFADLIMTAGKEIETPIGRLAQLARAVGIHLIIATQRPSVNVITGIIKANFPARIAFRVSAKVDSRTILDAGGADQLIGRGDMLIAYGSEVLRLQCAFVDTPEVERIVQFIGDQQGYPTAFQLPEVETGEDESGAVDVDLAKRDKLFEECARLVVNSQSGSTSMLQRKFNIGYNRAGRIMDQLEAAGIVGTQSGSKPRDVFVLSEYELDNLIINLP